jgi:hypothetical protein
VLEGDVSAVADSQYALLQLDARGCRNLATALLNTTEEGFTGICAASPSPLCIKAFGLLLYQQPAAAAHVTPDHSSSDLLTDQNDLCHQKDPTGAHDLYRFITLIGTADV